MSVFAGKQKDDHYSLLPGEKLANVNLTACEKK